MLTNGAKVTEIDQNSLVYFHNVVLFIYIQIERMKEIDFSH